MSIAPLPASSTKVASVPSPVAATGSMICKGAAIRVIDPVDKGMDLGRLRRTDENQGAAAGGAEIRDEPRQDSVKARRQGLLGEGRAERTCERNGDGAYLRGMKRATNVGLRAGDRAPTLECIEPRHVGAADTHAPLVGEALRVHDLSRPGAERIRIERHDDIGVGEAWQRDEIAAEREACTVFRGGVGERIMHIPAQARQDFS